LTHKQGATRGFGPSELRFGRRERDIPPARHTILARPLSDWDPRSDANLARIDCPSGATMTMSQSLPEDVWFTYDAVCMLLALSHGALRDRRTLFTRRDRETRPSPGNGPRHICIGRFRMLARRRDPRRLRVRHRPLRHPAQGRALPRPAPAPARAISPRASVWPSSSGAIACSTGRPTRSSTSSRFPARRYSQGHARSPHDRPAPHPRRPRHA
jgi:hypothetical protein